MTRLLEGRHAVITGGTGAIGRALLRVFAREGAAIAFTWHTRGDDARALADELTAGGAVVSAHRLDLTDARAGVELADRLEQGGFPVDVLVNNAGITEVLPFALIEEADWDRLLDVNTKGTFLVTRAFARGMLRRKHGSIVNLGSLAGHRLLDVPVHYATSKSAALGFTLSLARELGKYGIRVNTVVPGLLDAGISRNVPEWHREQFLQACALGRAGRAEEVAEVAAFVASDRASYVDAQLIHVNGGF